MKAFVSLRKEKKKGDKEAQENRCALFPPPPLCLPFLSLYSFSPLPWCNYLVLLFAVHVLRNYIVTALTESIQEIIRVLQLTSPTEEQGAFATSTGGDQTGLPGGLLPGSLAAKVHLAKELLSQSGKEWGGGREE